MTTAPSQTSDFLDGALQTAAEIAGEVLVADLLTGMLHHNQPQEIVGVIQDVPVDNLGASQLADPESAPEYFAGNGYLADDGFTDGDSSDSNFNSNSSFLGGDDLLTQPLELRAMGCDNSGPLPLFRSSS